MSRRFHLAALCPILLAVLFLAAAPDQVPLLDYHDPYDVTWGSKFFLVLKLPVAVCYPFWIDALWYRHLARSMESPGPEVYQHLALYAALGQSVLTGWLLLACWHWAVTGSAALALTLNQFYCAALGVHFLLQGNLIPKFPMQDRFGCRNRWSTKNDRVWQACQRMAGRVYVCCGLLILLGALWFSRGFACFTFAIPVLLGGYAVIRYRCWSIARADSTADPAQRSDLP